MEETEHEMRSEVDNPYCTFIPILKDGNKNNSRKYIIQPNHSINIFSGRDALNIYLFKGMTIEKNVNKKNLYLVIHYIILTFLSLSVYMLK